MTLPSRKALRLSEYEYDSPGAYFITVCTRERTPILGQVVGADDHIGPHTKLTSVGKLVEKYTRTIPGLDRYVIMPDHVHLLLRVSAQTVPEGPMWSSAPTKRNVATTIRSWKTLITKELGTGIWQRSYYEHVIRNQADYSQIVEYIEGNPAKWLERKGQ